MMKRRIVLPSDIILRLIRFLKGGAVLSTQDVYIGDIAVGRGRPCFFVAEIGINHNGSLEIAKKLIKAAAQAGAQAVKFQKRTVSTVYSPEELAKPRSVDRLVLENAIQRGILSKEAVQRLRQSNFQNSTNGDLKWALEFTELEYHEIFTYAKEQGVLCLASPWDLESVDFLEKFNPPCHKIASAMLTNHKLLRKVRVTGRPVILSTGMSTMEEIVEAVNVLGQENLILLHTVSTYPAKEGELELRLITNLRHRFPIVPIGYSGHETGLAPTLGAVAFGAHLVERHITLDRHMFGTDQMASLEPSEFNQLIKDVRSFESSVGSGIKKVLDSEIPIREKLRRH